ncbi:hypothetical protein R70211_02154 [Paraburkholderia domus]|uniref:Uncharacterized protein n=1 Tax=Paraburkholderia domus TaxID=2793075 RepID=A0A9N8MNC4_9BURK|nr:hypothetical protein R70211_02154 [Paraburkholderia domus]
MKVTVYNEDGTTQETTEKPARADDASIHDRAVL